MVISVDEKSKSVMFYYSYYLTGTHLLPLSFVVGKQST